MRAALASRGRVFANFSGEPFSKDDFADWYGGPGAVAGPEAPCTDPRNWSRAAKLKTRRARWQFIGTRADGTRVKGEAVLLELGELRESTSAPAP